MRRANYERVRLRPNAKSAGLADNRRTRQNQKALMLFDPARHEALLPIEWDEHRVRAIELSRSYLSDLESLAARNRTWPKSIGSRELGTYLSGEITIHMRAFGSTATAELGDRIAALIGGNLESPTRELMWGSPGTRLRRLPGRSSRNGDRQVAARGW